MKNKRALFTSLSFLGAFALSPLSAEYMASWEFSAATTPTSPIAGVVSPFELADEYDAEASLSWNSGSLVMSDDQAWLQTTNATIPAYLEFELTNLPSELTDLTFDMLVWRDHGNSGTLTGVQINTLDRDTGLWSGFGALSGFSITNNAGSNAISGSILADAATVSQLQFRIILEAGNTTGNNAGRQIRFTDPEFVGIVGAIPEPATYAAIFGALALAGALVVRRRKRAR